MIHVTEALSPFSSLALRDVPAERLQQAAERGRRIHAAVAAELSGLFCVHDLTPDEEMRAMSLIAWSREYLGEVIAIEPELRDEALGFMGSPDLVCRLKSGTAAVVDWKTPTTIATTWGAQLAAYAHLAAHAYGLQLPIARMVLIPSESGATPRAYYYDDQDRDFAAFLAALTAYRYFVRQERSKK